MAVGFRPVRPAQASSTLRSIYAILDAVGPVPGTTREGGNPEAAETATTSEVDRRLGALLLHAEYLRAGIYIPEARTTGGPSWPAPPTAGGRHGLAVALAIAVALVATLLLAPRAQRAADLVFGSPARPTLVGHKIGSPWHPASPPPAGNQP